MRKWMTSAMAAAVCGACFVAGQVSAQEDGGGGFPTPEWAQKGPENTELMKWVGDWDVKTEIWMAPGAAPMESAGTATYASLWDDRYLESSFQGEMMGTSFTGRLLMGFDRVDKEYVAIWIDSGSTYISVSRGASKDGVISLETNDPDWMTGEKKKGKLNVSWTDENTGVVEMLSIGPDGTEQTSVRMTYTRKEADKPDKIEETDKPDKTETEEVR